MFKWLTRNDGARKARLRRRIRSPRGSVFAEFAIVMPVVLLMCSAIFELLGFWDAQVMANHAAWQVGRIAAVRGDDGMAFSDTVSKMSKTGVVSEKMPAAIQAVLKPLVTSVGGALDRFNDRGAITTMFLMSTCGIGYYGPSPGEALSQAFEKLIDDAVKGVVEELPAWAEEWAKEKTDWIPAGDGVIGKLITDVLNSIVNSAVKPIMEMIGGYLKEWAKTLVEMLNLDDLFSGGGAAERRARQIYGAAMRVLQAPEAVSSVKELEEKDGPFVFAKIAKMGRLAYPLVVDKEAKSDGYFVTGAHGWPANNGALKLVKVDVKWPYSRGWLFPVVSGYGETSAPVAQGTAIAFPQPGITDKNLWSTGAVEYAAGDYTNKMSDAYKEVADAMKGYLALARFGMQYRLRSETIWLVDEQPEWYHSGSPKHCSPLYELFNSKSGDYASCWSSITDGKSQSEYMTNLEDYFKSSSYRGREYFCWEGTFHRRYAGDMVLISGRAGYWDWCNANPQCCASTAGAGQRTVSALDFLGYCHGYIMQLSDARLNPGDVYDAYIRFNSAVGGFRLRDMVQWKNPSDYGSWYSLDMRTQNDSKNKADKRFGQIKSLLNAEIADIQNILDGKMDDYQGDDGDSVIIDPSDQKAIDDPEAAAAEAMKRWLERKAELKVLLQTIDRKIRDPNNGNRGLNSSWSAYKSAVASIKSARLNAVTEDMAKACIRVCIATRSLDILRNGDVSAFAEVLRRENLISYDIVGETSRFAAVQDGYCDALEQSFNAELEYGVKLGLKSAGKIKKSGKSIDDLDFDTDVYPEGHGGTLGPGSDSGWPIDGDEQRWTPGRGWQ